MKDWLERHIWPAEGNLLSPGFVYDATRLACLEMIRAGVTTYNDMYFFGASSAAAAKEIGVRAFIGAGILDFPGKTAKTPDEYLGNAEKFILDWRGEDLITPCLAPHSAYACGPETLKKIRDMAARLGAMVGIHLSETEWEVGEIISRYGRRPVEHLEAIGFLNGRVIAAHCVWLDDREMELLARRGVGVSHCIESNLKLASGIAPVPAMLRAGIKVTFGTDGAASNNDLNIFSEMSTAAKVHKAAAKDPTVLDSKTALLMATRWGAEALGVGGDTGSLEKGKLADIVIVDLKRPHLTPVYDVYSHMVYAAAASDVETVMINGALVVDAKGPATCDERGIMQKASEWGSRIAAYNSGHRR